MSQPRAHAPLPLHAATEPYTSSQQTASTYSWLCHSGFLLQCSALGKGLLIKNQGSSARASSEIREADRNLAPLPVKLWCEGPGPQVSLSRETVSASVGSRGWLFLLLLFCQWRKLILCPFHRQLRQHCACSYVTEWQLLWRKWSHASGIFASGRINHLAK